MKPASSSWVGKVKPDQTGAPSRQSPLVRDAPTQLVYGLGAYFSFLIYALGPTMPFLRSELDLSYSEVGLHSSAFATGMLAAGAIGDRVAHRLGRRATVWTGTAGLAVGALALAAGHHLAATVCAALLMGSVGSLVHVMIGTILADQHGERSCMALTEVSAIGSACGVIAPLLIGWLGDSPVGWRAAYLLAAASFIPLLVRFGRLSLAKHGGLSTISRSPPDARLPLVYWAHWALIALVVSIEFGILFWAAAFLSEERGLARSTAAAMTSIFLATMFLGRWIGSRLAHDVVSTQRWLRIALLVCGGGFLLYWQSRPTALALSGLAVSGLGVANLYPWSLSLGIAASGNRVEAAVARAAAASGLAILTAPFALGRLSDQFGLGRAQSAVLGLIIAAFVVSWALSEKEQVNE